MSTNTIIAAHGLSKVYAMGDVTVHALQAVDFAASAGEFVAIMGPSGSGKSTLMHLLGGLDAPSGGEVRLNGQALTAMDDDQLTLTRRREIGFIFQFFNLMPTLTAAENVALPVLIDGGKPDAGRVRDLLALTGLDGRADHKPHQLSGGQQQRVAIARALITNPKIILADEPTGNLDSESGDAILGLLRRACDEQGQTIIMVTHNNRSAATADRIVFLKDGQMVSELDFNVPHEVHDKTRTQEVAAFITDLEL